jgi:hypothetical protein
VKLSTLELAEKIDRRYRGEVLRLQRAAYARPWDGRSRLGSEHRARVQCITEPALAVSVLLTFDHGPHAVAGWWRNSQYDRCWHLSLVGFVRGARTPTPVELPREEVAAWGLAFYGEDAAKAWNEPPAGEGDAYRGAEVSRYTWHTRLFVDQQMQPIVPEGEVYTLIPFDDGSSPEKVFRS